MGRLAPVPGPSVSGEQLERERDRGLRLAVQSTPLTQRRVSPPRPRPRPRGSHFASYRDHILLIFGFCVDSRIEHKVVSKKWGYFEAEQGGIEHRAADGRPGVPGVSAHMDASTRSDLIFVFAELQYHNFKS